MHLRKEAQESLQYHISDVIPEEYQPCMSGIKENLRQTLEIADTVAAPRVLEERIEVIEEEAKTTNGVF